MPCCILCLTNEAGTDKNSPDRGLRSSPDLDADLESHIVMNVSSTLTNTTIWFVAALFDYGRTDGRTVWTDGRTYRRTDIFTGFIRTSLRR